MAITFFLEVAAQIRLDFHGRKFNSASFASRELLEKSILKVLEGGYFFIFFHFFKFLQLQAAVAPSKKGLHQMCWMENNRNFMLKTMSSSDFSLVENSWRYTVFYKVKK